MLEYIPLVDWYLRDFFPKTYVYITMRRLRFQAKPDKIIMPQNLDHAI